MDAEAAGASAWQASARFSYQACLCLRENSPLEVSFEDGFVLVSPLPETGHGQLSCILRGAIELRLRRAVPKGRSFFGPNVSPSTMSKGHQGPPGTFSSPATLTEVTSRRLTSCISCWASPQWPHQDALSRFQQSA